MAGKSSKFFPFAYHSGTSLLACGLRSLYVLRIVASATPVWLPISAPTFGGYWQDLKVPWDYYICTFPPVIDGSILIFILGMLSNWCIFGINCNLLSNDIWGLYQMKDLVCQHIKYVLDIQWIWWIQFLSHTTQVTWQGTPTMPQQNLNSFTWYEIHI